MYLVALTGGIGSGKSAVANIFHKLGIDIVDCDVIARKLTAPKSPISNKIIQHFGKGILGSSLCGSDVIDREKLSQIIFNNKDEKIWLEKILHPEIIKIMREHIKKSKSKYVIVAIPLLFETKQDKNFNRILTVTCNKEVKLERLKLRDKKDITELENIITQQINDEYRKKHSDDIINNDGDFNNLKQQVLNLHQKYLEFANNK
ncbi:MAG: dephospho-CoA kinase [Gammaproteobacteria bacterium]|nr:dephospho-CoA kinase [Gammaproteobacteria bacterium]